MHSILKNTPIRGINFVGPKFLEPHTGEFNNHFYQRVKGDIRLIKQGLEIHGYPMKKLNGREVWRIGKGDSLYLLSYHADPFEWVLLPHNDNLARIIAYSLTTA